MQDKNRIDLDEGMILRQEDPRMELGTRNLKLSHFGSQGEWYGRVLEGDMKGKVIQLQPGEELLKKVPSRFSDDDTWEKIKIDAETLPWSACRQ